MEVEGPRKRGSGRRSAAEKAIALPGAAGKLLSHWGESGGGGVLRGFWSFGWGWQIVREAGGEEFFSIIDLFLGSFDPITSAIWF